MTEPAGNPLICAIDDLDLDRATALAGRLAGAVGGIKLGLAFHTAHGSEGVRRVAAGAPPLFLDLKFHDIPNTVAHAVRAAIRALAPDMLTVHLAGGPAMLRAAVDEAAAAGERRPLVVGVTVLTSLDDDDLAAVGVAAGVDDQVARLTDLAVDCGLDGVVCSARELAALRRRCPADFRLIVPGIRPAGAEPGDQKRIMTPAAAIAAGADRLVVGRPITTAGDPVAAARAIVDSLDTTPVPV